MGKVWGSTLQRNTPLQRNTMQRSKRPKDQHIWGKVDRSHKLQRKAPMRKRSKALEKKLRTVYNPAQREFLSRPENRYCAVCACLSAEIDYGQFRLIMDSGIEQSEQALRNLGARMVPSSEVHHLRGRAASLLCDQRGFIPCCFQSRTWPHDNPKKARELGLLGTASEWNSPFDRVPQ